jgi:serine/threonine protein kinase
MLGTVAPGRSVAYLAHMEGYIIVFRAHTIEGGKALETSAGTVLGGRYRVQSTLGSGGMAIVYRAEDAILGRPVALKTLHRRYAEMPSFRRRFRQEARAMASLDHENIVKVYDISEDDGVPFIVAECVAGKDIGSLLGRHGGTHLNEQFTRRAAEQLLRALSYAHGRGIIHRDVKPSNILVTADGTVKVADFGIARIVEEDDGVEVGEPAEIVGSARYMSPEQLMGKEATPKSDIYSVGVLLYHCLTGSPPFSGDVKVLAKQHLYMDPALPRKLNKKISPQMEAVIMKAMAKNPDDRYPSATAMLDDIGARALPKNDKKTRESPKPALRKAAPRRGGKKGLVLASTLALLILLGGGALASALGYADLPPYGDVGEVLSRMEPVETGSPVPPGSSRELAQEPGEAASEEAASENVAVAQEVPRDLVLVPNVLTFFDYYAADTLVNKGFDVRIVYDYREGYAARGVTWATDPAIGTFAPRGSTITVYATPKDRSQPQF